MAKAKTSQATKQAHKSTGCKSTIIKFTNKRGKVIEFKGRAGKSCGPRKTSSSARAREVRSLLAKAGKQCGARHGYFTKEAGKCVRDAFKTSFR